MCSLFIVQLAEGLVLFGGHLRLGLRRLVALPRQVEDAVYEDAVQLVHERHIRLYGIRTHRVYRDEDIAVEGGWRGVVERDDIRVVVMPEELTVDLQLPLVGTEDIIDVPYGKTVPGGYRLNPLCRSALVEERHVYAVCGKTYHYMCMAIRSG